jgi:hypothetical protein
MDSNDVTPIIAGDGKAPLVNYHMKQCNLKLSDQVINRRSTIWTEDQLEGEQRVEEAMKMRLRMNLPYVLASGSGGTWIEAMGVGAMPLNVLDTKSSLDEMINIVFFAGSPLSHQEDQDQETQQFDSSVDQVPILERARLTTVYALTELHLLTDSTPNQQDTWKYLHTLLGSSPQSILAMLPGVPGGGGGLSNAELLFAAQTSIQAIGGAALSLAGPAKGLLGGAAPAALAGGLVGVIPGVMDALMKMAGSSKEGQSTSHEDKGYSNSPNYNGSFSDNKVDDDVEAMFRDDDGSSKGFNADHLFPK